MSLRWCRFWWCKKQSYNCANFTWNVQFTALLLALMKRPMKVWVGLDDRPSSVDENKKEMIGMQLTESFSLSSNSSFQGWILYKILTYFRTIYIFNSWLFLIFSHTKVKKIIVDNELELTRSWDQSTFTLKKKDANHCLCWTECFFKI